MLEYNPTLAEIRVLVRLHIGEYKQSLVNYIVLYYLGASII